MIDFFFFGTQRFLLYLKLFLGMGFVWTFEIVAGFLDVHEAFWYAPDVFNMGQGFYVFFIFVCKRNVLKLIFAPNTPQGKVVEAITSKTRNANSGDIAGRGRKPDKRRKDGYSEVSGSRSVVGPSNVTSETMNATSEYPMATFKEEEAEDAF